MKKTPDSIVLYAGIALALCALLFGLLRKEPQTVLDASRELTAGYASTEEKSMAVYRYMTRNFRYDFELRDAVLSQTVTKHTPDTQRILNDRKGICCDLAVLYAAMLESQKIEVKIVKGYRDGAYHAWNSVFDEETGKWMQVDVTSDLWYGRSWTAWPAFDTARYTVSADLDYSETTPLTFGSGS